MSLEYPEYPKYPDFGESMLARIGYSIWHINGISCKHLYNIMPQDALSTLLKQAKRANDKELETLVNYLICVRKAVDKFLKSGKPHVDKMGKPVIIKVPDS